MTTHLKKKLREPTRCARLVFEEFPSSVVSGNLEHNVRGYLVEILALSFLVIGICIAKGIPKCLSVNERINPFSKLRKMILQLHVSRILVGFFIGSFGNEPMQSCSVHCVSLLLASVYSPPSDRFDHRSFISLQIYAAMAPSICT